MAPDRNNGKKVDENVKKKEILIKEYDIQYNISTRLQPQSHPPKDTAERSLQNYAASKDIFTILEAKKQVQDDAP
ncbi:hypothetical protein C922_03603 [Plasmodium inui San Antonio 1]|uniref:Uncharacterized protein n=1 Tax=Plasmodium inui San Antonio 1 TaxID=1237626 RepID=W7A9Q9_9APIC|nr:hypothetical protein C922_03603 [Plasmodium inui San Antonio 1]EUD65879.1 hypothetical protein C922_03603 [Plasmodium inui San Antonio 1]